MKKIIFLFLFSLLLLSLIFGTIFAKAQTDLPPAGITPDSYFYFLESFFERIGTFFTFGDIAKAERYANLANERIGEVKAVIEKGKPKAAEKALIIYQDQLEKALIKIEQAQVKGKNVSEIAEIVTQVTLKHLTVLEEVLEKVPKQTKSAVLGAREVSKTSLIKAIEVLSKEKPERAVEVNIQAIRDRLAKIKNEVGKGNEEDIERVLADLDIFQVSLEKVGKENKIALNALVSEAIIDQIENLDEIEERSENFSPQIIEKIKATRESAIDLHILTIKEIIEKDIEEGIEILRRAGMNRINRVKKSVEKKQIERAEESLKEYKKYSDLAKEIAQNKKGMVIRGFPVEELVRQSLGSHLGVLHDIKNNLPREEKEFEELIQNVIEKTQVIGKPTIESEEVIRGRPTEITETTGKVIKLKIREGLKMVDREGKDISERLPLDFEKVTILKEEKPVVDFRVHFEKAKGEIDFSNLKAEIDVNNRKSFFYGSFLPEIVEEEKYLYIPSTGAGAVLLCPSVISLEEVTPECPLGIPLLNILNGRSYQILKKNVEVSLVRYKEGEYYKIGPLFGLGWGGMELDVKRPDIVITDLHFSTTTPIVGEEVIIIATIENLGETEGKFEVLFYEDKPKYFNIEEWEETVIHKNLKSGEKIIFTTEITLPVKTKATPPIKWIAKGEVEEICVLAALNSLPKDIKPENNWLCKRIKVQKNVITGKVIDYNGLPVKEAFVVVRGPDYVLAPGSVPDYLANRYTDENGEYIFSDIRKEGKYEVEVEEVISNPNLMPARCSVEVTIGKQGVCNFVLQPAGSIAGRVEKQPEEEILVYLSGIETPRYAVGKEGNYVIGQLKAGTYTINIWKGEEGPVSYYIYVNGEYKKYGSWVTVEIKLGQTTNVDFYKKPLF